MEEKTAFFREKASIIFEQLRVNVYVYEDEYTQHARGLLDLIEDIDEYSEHVKETLVQDFQNAKPLDTNLSMTDKDVLMQKIREVGEQVIQSMLDMNREIQEKYSDFVRFSEEKRNIILESRAKLEKKLQHITDTAEEECRQVEREHAEMLEEKLRQNEIELKTKKREARDRAFREEEKLLEKLRNDLFMLTNPLSNVKEECLD